MGFKVSSADKKEYDVNGYVIVNNLISADGLPILKRAFRDLFNGRFETGVTPDEVNWQFSSGDASLTRQICNGWKANRAIAKIVLDQALAENIARLSGWPGVRIMSDNVLWKPPTARPLGFHQDSAYLAWYTPPDLVSCWIALDDTDVKGGTLEYIKGSHLWKQRPPEGDFHGPDNYRLALQNATKCEGVEAEVTFVEVSAGGGSIHHGWTWHGSGTNTTNQPRRALVLHAMRSDVEYVPKNLSQGTGPIYSRYKHLSDNLLDENYFPILWQKDGYRTPQIEDYLNN